MRSVCRLRHLSAAIALVFTSVFASVITHAQNTTYPNFVTDAQVPIPTADDLSSPTGLAVAPGGTVYVADSGNHRVLRISPAGVQTTVSFGNLKPALAAPSGVALDLSGNLYVTDTTANRVIKLPAGATNGLAIITGLNAPTAIAVDTAGNLAVLNSGNSTITERRGGGQPAIFNIGTTTLRSPVALAFNLTGDLYVADLGPLYLFPKLGGTGADVTPTGVYSQLLAGVATDRAGNVFLAQVNDNVQRSILELPAAGGPALTIPTTPFAELSAIATDSIGNIYFADSYYDYSTRPTINKLYFNNAANFGSVPVGASSSTILINVGFYQATTINSVQAVGGGVIGNDFHPSDYYQESRYPSSDCDVGDGNHPPYIGIFPSVCTFAYHFQPTMAGGRPGALLVHTSIGTAQQLLYGNGLGAQLALLNASVTPKLTSYNISGIIANASSTELYFAADDGTYKAPIGSNTGTLISTSAGQMAVNGAGDLFLFNAPNITKIPADGSATSTIHVPGLITPTGFAMDYNGTFYIGDAGNNVGFFSGMIHRVSSTGAASQILPGKWGGPNYLTTDNSGNLYVEDVGLEVITAVQVGDGSLATRQLETVLTGESGDNPFNLAVDESGTAYYWTQGPTAEGLVYVAPDSTSSSFGCTQAGSCYLPVYANPGLRLDFGYQPFLSATGPQTFAAATNGNLYVANGNGSGVFLINRQFGTILPQAFQPGFENSGGNPSNGYYNVGNPTQLANVYNIGNQPLVFTNNVNAYTQSGNTTAFTLGTGSCVPGASILPGDFCTVPVTDANPPTTPYAVDTLHFLTSAVNNNTATFKITGPPAP